MPRQVPLDNIGPNDLAYEIAAAGEGFQPSLVIVTIGTQPGSSPDKVQLVTNAFQADGNGRPILDAGGQRVKIAEHVEEYPRDGFLYQHRRDESMAAATVFEVSGKLIPQAIPTPPALVQSNAPAPAPAPVASGTPVASSVTTPPSAPPLPAVPS